MSNAIHQFQLETSGASATLYISEELPHDHLDALCEACAALPPYVRTLRLDLHGVRRLSVEMMATLRVLMREWRLARGGNCRLSFSTENLVLTYTETAAATLPSITSLPSRGAWSGHLPASDAMTAAYL